MFAFATPADQAGNEEVYVPNSCGVHRPSGEIPVKDSNIELNITAGKDAVSQSFSMVSIQTTGTFGPINRSGKTSTIRSTPIQLAIHIPESSAASRLALERVPSPLIQTHGWPRDDDEETGGLGIAALRFTLSEHLGSLPDADTSAASPRTPHSYSSTTEFLESPSFYRASSSSVNLSQDGFAVSANVENDDQLLTYSASCQTLSTLPSPSFAPPSPSPSGNFSIASSNSAGSFWKKFRFSGRNDSPVKGLLTRSIPLQSPSRLNGISPTEFEFPDSAPCSPDTTTAPTMIHRHRRLLSHSTVTSVTSCPPASALRNIPLPKPGYEDLTQTLSWLRDIKLHLSIDQEGFRGIEAKFRFAGWSETAHSLCPFDRNTEDADTTSFHAGIADFVPTTRQIFNFHQSTLDSPPVLRRISVNGDESREYISRHASLTLKRNGVYTVSGSEAVSPSLLSLDSDDTHGFDGNTRLKWKLEYIVLDRKADTRGKAMAGEKTLTPLSFSFSPFLLHPLQGKKVRLIRILKMNVIAKLLAEILEPPIPPHTFLESYRQVLAQTKRIPTSTSPRPLHKKRNSWSLHKRAQSQVLDENHDPRMLKIAECRPTKPARRRRASSAGDQRYFNLEQVAKETTRPLGPQNILPIAQLNQMMDGFALL